MKQEREDRLWIAAHRLDEFDELHDVEAPLAVLVFRNEGLRSPDPFGQHDLRQSGLFACLDQQVDETLMARGSDRLEHAPARV